MTPDRIVAFIFIALSIVALVYLQHRSNKQKE